MSNLDPFTYGNSKACINLADIINKLDNPKVTRGVGSLISSFHHKMLYCRAYTRAITVEIVMMYRKQYLEKINSRAWPDNVKSHVRNIIFTVGRSWFKTYSSSKGRAFWEIEF